MKYTEALESLERAEKLDEWIKSKGPKLVRSMRRRKKMTVREFADYYGWSDGYISHLEVGRTPLQPEFAIRLLKEYLGGVKNA